MLNSTVSTLLTNLIAAFRYGCKLSNVTNAYHAAVVYLAMVTVPRVHSVW